MKYLENSKTLKIIGIIVIIALFSLAISMVYLIVESRSIGMQCQNNPFLYGAEKTEEVTGSQLICSCSFSDGKYIPFTYDKQGIRTKFEEQTDVLYNGKNISELLSTLKE